MLIGTIDFYQFISLSVTLTLAGVYKAKPVGLIFSHTFQLNGMIIDMDQGNIRCSADYIKKQKLLPLHAFGR